MNTTPEWNRVLRDLRPTEIMRTFERVKPAVGALWLARTVDDEALERYADCWKQAGWTADEWWQLAASVHIAVCQRATEQQVDNAQVQQRYRTEFAERLVPETWVNWRDLAAEHGALVATRALLDSSDLELETKLFWARADEKITQLGVGKPGELLN